ncbi:hypothetical protein CGZ69_03815 [Streptomyces peucetius subsp. caesius ATCC 27952]|nr:hypothetical protein CGZ69_03815 [Streptomyces peucetius subsp. caesius ATCC 27952]
MQAGGGRLTTPTAATHLTLTHRVDVLELVIRGAVAAAASQAAWWAAVVIGSSTAAAEPAHREGGFRPSRSVPEGSKPPESQAVGDDEERGTGHRGPCARPVQGGHVVGEVPEEAALDGGEPRR